MHKPPERQGPQLRAQQWHAPMNQHHGTDQHQHRDDVEQKFLVAESQRRQHGAQHVATREECQWQESHW